jgi:uncharacterized membrane protein
MTSAFWRMALLAGALACTFASQAQAGLRLCNRTSYVLYAATGYVRGVDAITQGWTRIVPGTCETAIQEPLTGRGYFVYARTSLAHAGTSRAWGGNQPLCVKDSGFSLQVPVASLRCPAEDTFARPFAGVATQRQKNWTMTFDEAPAYLSMADAAQAGTKRLLRDMGAKIAAIDTRPDKAVDAALTIFRKNHKFSSNGTALFDALESEALRTTAPAGYAVCNDTAGPLWAAIGFQVRNIWASRGWWKIAPKGCAKLISEALTADKIYLLAEKPSGAAVATGPNKFCITNAEFEIQGRTNCPSHGQIEAGFAETRTKGRSGFTAHVGDTGLIAPRVIYVGTPK